MSEIKAVYAGTFDPITFGHLDVIERALKVFSKLSIAVTQTSTKHMLLDAHERLALVKHCVKSFDKAVEVSLFDGLLVDYAQLVGASVLVRGLRAVSDYEYEARMAMANRRLATEIETVFLVTSEKHSFISSSIVKDVARHGGDITTLVPKVVAERLKDGV